jgi:hypothetical protein
VPGHEEYIEILREQTHTFKNTNITLMWAEGAQYPKLELQRQRQRQRETERDRERQRETEKESKRNAMIGCIEI